MPAIYVHVACCQLYYCSVVSLIYGKYLANVYFGDIPHTFILHFTLHSAEKNPNRIFRKLLLDNFHIPRSAKYPFPMLPTSVGKFLKVPRMNFL